MCISASSIFFHGLLAQFFLALDTLPLSECTTVHFYLSVHLLKDILVISKFRQLRVKLLLLLLLLLLSLQSCPTLCDPIDGSPPGFPVPGILQARTLEWVAISFSSAWKWKVKVKSLSRVRLLQPHGLQPTRLLSPWDFPGKSTGVGCHCLLHSAL